jgi:anti-sigma B factor antagonist
VTASSLDIGDTDLVRIEITGELPAVRLVATGEIDSSSAPTVRTRLDEVLGKGCTDLTIDLSGVTFLDSAGLCVLAAAHRRATRSGVRLQVIATSRAVIRPMQITGLYDLLHVVSPESGAA